MVTHDWYLLKPQSLYSSKVALHLLDVLSRDIYMANSFAFFDYLLNITVLMLLPDHLIQKYNKPFLSFFPVPNYAFLTFVYIFYIIDYFILFVLLLLF